MNDSHAANLTRTAIFKRSMPMKCIYRTASAFTLLAPMLLAAAAEDSLDWEALTSPSPEYGLAVGPDGHYLTRQNGNWGENGASSILRYSGSGATLSSPAWADPAASESSFYFSDRQNLGCFESDRASSQNLRGANLWCVRWLGDRWSEAYELPAPVNSDATEYSPVVRDDGNLFFASDRSGGAGLGDIYVARQNGDSWTVDALGDSVNSSGGEWNVEVSPGGEFLLFEASHRNTNRTVPGDLYMSRAEADGWGDAVPLSLLNTNGSDLMPRFLSDETFAYARSEGADVDMHLAHIDRILPIEPVVAAVSRSQGQVHVLDPESLQTLQRIDVGAGPHDVASSEDGRLAVVPLFGIFPKAHEGPIEPGELQWQSRPSAGVAVVDLSAANSTITRPLNDCKRPHGSVTTAQAHRAWITCENEGTVLEIDPRTGQTVRTFRVEEGVHKLMHLPKFDVLAATSPSAGEAYLIDLESGQIVRFETGSGAEALAASEDHATIYVANSQDRTVCEISVTRRELVSCVPSGGHFPIALAVDADENKLWVAHNTSSELVSISIESGKVIDRIPLPSPLLGMAFDARSRMIYVGLPRRNEILKIDADTHDVVVTNGSIGEIDDIDLIPAVHFGYPPDT